MGIRFWSVAAGIFALAFVFILIFKQFDEQSPIAPTEQVRQVDKMVRISYEITNSRETPSNEIVFWAEMPGNFIGRQRISIDTLREDSFDGASFNDGLLELVVGQISPFGKRRVDVVLRAELSDSSTARPLLAGEISRYLSSESLVNRDHDQIIRLADTLSGESTHESSRLVYEWVSKNIQSLAYTLKPKAAVVVLQERQGDCTEMMFLVVSILRAQGIPARMMAGYLVERDSLKLDSSMYHNWAEFHDGSRWVISDPQRRKFDQAYSEYLAVKEVNSKSVLGTRFGVKGSAGVSVNIL